MEEEGSGDLGGRVRRAQSGPLEPESLGDIPGDVLQAGLDLLAPSSRPSCLRCGRRPIPDPGHNLALHATSFHHLVTLNTEGH